MNNGYHKVKNSLTRKTKKGYTLVEVLVAMGLFLVVIVPLIGHMSVAIKINKGKNKMVAASIIEQESSVLRMFPDETFNVKRRKIGGREWVIKTSFKGGKLKTCRISAHYKGKEIGKAIFYLYKD